MSRTPARMCGARTSPFRASGVGALAAALLLAVLSSPNGIAQQPPSAPAAQTTPDTDPTPDGATAPGASRADEQFRFAEGLLARRFYEMADPEFRKFLEKWPDHPNAASAMLGRIQCLRERNRPDDANRIIQEFRRRWPKHELTPRLVLWQGDLLLRSGRTAEAEKVFRRLLNTPEEGLRETGVYYLARSLALQGKTEEALKTFARLAAKELAAERAYRPYAVFALGDAAHHAGTFSEASEHFRRLTESPHVPKGLREESLYRLAEIRFTMNEFGEAVKLYESLLVEYPDGPFVREVRKRRALAFYRMKNFERAGELAAEWRTSYPAHSDPQMLLLEAISLQQAKRYERALEPLRQLLADRRVPDTTRAEGQVQQVICLLQLKRHNPAAQAAARFLEEFPNHESVADIRYLAARALGALGQREKAIEMARTALAQALPGWEYRVDCTYLLAQAFEQSGDLTSIAQLYRDLSGDTALPPQERAAHRLRAAEYERDAQNMTAAMRDLEHLLRTFPNAEAETRTAALYLAEVYAVEKRFQQAEELVAELLAGPAGKTLAGRLHYLLGYTFYVQGRYKEAESELQAAMAAPGGTRIANDAKLYLVGVLLGLERRDEALDRFAELLQLPADKRPKPNPELMFQLEDQYYRRNRYDTCEQLCLWLRRSEDPHTRTAGSLRYARLLTALHRNAEARNVLEELLTTEANGEAPGAATEMDGDIRSMLGEVLFALGETDLAVASFEKVLSGDSVDLEAATRARWGMAAILRGEERHEQALRYAVNAFVLGRDPVYTPRAMLIAIQVLVQQERRNEALTTWQELQTRFPAFALREKGDPAVADLLASGTAPPDESGTAPAPQPQ